jgi:hypothetical protein
MYHDVSRDEDPPPALPAPEEGDGDGRAEKKERVLHTRVPAVLEAELKRFAQNLRIPVSNLVRTILEDALQMADAAGENVEARLKKAARQIEEERERLKRRVMPDKLRDVLAFQSVTLAQPASCAKCGSSIKPGERAHLGISDNAAPGAPRVFVCDPCLPTIPA